MATHTAMAQGSNASMRSSLEQHLGIVHFVSAKKHGWSGQSRTRFTDFQVNEILKDGEIAHLTDFYNNSRELARATSQSAATPPNNRNPSQPNEPMRTAGKGDVAVTSQECAAEEKSRTQVEEPPKHSISEPDKKALVDLLGQKTAEELIEFYAKIQQNPKAAPKTRGDVSIPTIGDKSRRSQVHGEIRRIFSGKIETTTCSDDSIKATATREGNRQRGSRLANAGIRNSGQNPTQDKVGPYLHFSLYKENKDTMDALSHMAKILRLHPKAFGAAGTKDRRAVTVQRVSIKGRSPASLIAVNERISSLKIGDFNYAQDPIRLNDHDGNEFVIVLKNCVFSGTENLSFEETLNVAKLTIDSALTQVIQRGFINYYGTQRFGTHQIGTQEVGMKLLKEDFAGAIQALLSYDPLLLSEDYTKSVHREDINRARACSVFLETKSSKAALDHLPARCHVEKTIISHLGKNPTDFVGALMSINRSMRTMYGHAYQSLVWNFVASKRWERFGAQVVNGDLVLVKSKSAALYRPDDEDRPEGHIAWSEDIAAAHNSGFVPHAVTEDDLLDRKFSIYDIVLPSPGWDVIYPANEIGDFYAEFMGKPENGGLDPHNMRRRQRDFSLPGSYRKLMGRLKGVPTASVQAYSDDLEQLVPTDLDIIRSRKAKEAAESNTQQQSATTSWHSFTQNVCQNELEESKAKVAHRESEDPTPSIRINDTWVQTSVDGSNKRIRIAKHSDVGVNQSESISTANETTMQAEYVSHGDKPAEISANTVKIDQQDEIDGAQTHQLAHQILASSIIAAVKAQPDHQELQSRSFEASPRPTSANGEATPTANTSDPIPQMTSTPNSPRLDTDSNSIQISSRSQLSNGSDNITSVMATDILEPAGARTIAPSDSTDTKKIAVVLRFALDTSQYATIVIRELQGAYTEKKDSA
ncbi:pseudouridine synthase [Nemania diffusa]|nr:pseudouridine synthase [Nemania diffusa]